MACEIVMYINFGISLNLRTGIGVLASLLKKIFFLSIILRKCLFFPSSLIFHERAFCALFRSNNDSFRSVSQAAAKISVIVFKLMCTFLTGFSTT